MYQFVLKNMNLKNIAEFEKEWAGLHIWTSDDLETKEITPESKNFLKRIGLPSKDNLFVLEKTLPTFENGVIFGYVYWGQQILYGRHFYLKKNTDECWVSGSRESNIANLDLERFLKSLTEYRKSLSIVERLVRGYDEIPEKLRIKELNRLDNRLRKIDPSLWTSEKILVNFWAELTTSIRLT